MRTLLYACTIAAVCVISGCGLGLYGMDFSNPESQTGGKMVQPINEFTGPHYAKLNSIGCLNYSDCEMSKSADFDTIYNLIRDKRCFVIPTDTNVYIIERVKGDIVSAKLKESAQLFYTVKSNLVSQ